MPELPSGTVTFLFTDIEGSTRLLRRLGTRYGDVLSAHAALLRKAFEANGGREIDTQGDSFFVAFRTAKDAVTAAVAAQRAVAAHSWPDEVDLRVRMGIHTGEPAVAEDRYLGLGVHRAARICGAAHGGQVLLSSTTRDLVEDDALPGVDLRDLGEQRLKDFDRPERVFQLVVDGLRESFPPLAGADGATELKQFAGRESRLVEAAEEAVAGRRWTDALTLPRFGWILVVLGIAVVVPLVAILRDGEEPREAPARVLVPPRSLAVVDPESNRVVGSVRLDGSPSSVLVAAGAVWVASRVNRTLVRIDPRSRSVQKTIGLGFSPDALADGGRVIWVAGGTPDHVLLPVAASSNEVLEPVRVDGVGHVVLVAGEDAVWLGDHGLQGISRLDPETGGIVAEICCSVTAEALGLGSDSLWAVERDDQAIVRVDTEVNAVRATIPFGAPIPPPWQAFSSIPDLRSAVAVGEGGVWITDSMEGKVWRLDPVSSSIKETIRVGTGSRAIAIGAGVVWVANRIDGSVSKIDPQTNRVVATVEVGERVEGLAVGEGSVWVAVP